MLQFFFVLFKSSSLHDYTPPFLSPYPSPHPTSVSRHKPRLTSVLQSEWKSVRSDSLWPHGLCCPWNSLGQNTGVGSLSLLQGFFPTQGSNPGLLHSRWILYQLSHKGSPRILEWVAYSFSSGSSQFRNWTGVSCIASGFFTNSCQGSLRVTEWLLLNTKWTTAELLMWLGEGGLSLCLSCLCGQQKNKKPLRAL